MYSPNLNAIMSQLEKEDEEHYMPFPLFPSDKTGKNTDVTNKKILLVSEHCHQYSTNSKVSWNLLKELSLSFDICHFGISPSEKVNVDCRPYPENVDCCKIDEPGLGFNTLTKYIQSVAPDYIIIYNNLELINQYIMFLNSKKLFQGKLILYVDMLYYNINTNYVSLLNSSSVSKIFVTSTFCKDILTSNKITKPIGVLHYGVDSVLAPVIDKRIARSNIKMSNKCFTFLVPCPNLQQYRYDIIISAYVKLLSKYPNRELRLFCLCLKDSPGGHSILEIFKQELILNNMDVTPHLKNILLSNEHLLNDSEKHNIFNCADVGICVPENEGLNLSSLEMMSIGLPQIVPKSGQFLSYCNDKNSILLPADNRYYLSRKMRTELSEARAVNGDDLFLAMERYLLKEGLCKIQIDEKTVAEYSWSFVTRELFSFLN
jgi:hypothetical protein